LVLGWAHQVRKS